MKRHGYWLASLMVIVAPGCGNDTDVAAPSTGDEKGIESQTKCMRRSLPLAVPCEQLVGTLQFPNAVFTSATSVPAGALTYAGQSIPAHCQLTGSMYNRIGADGNPYAIGFEMRLPLEWNRRYFYQANGGLDGAVVPGPGLL